MQTTWFLNTWTLTEKHFYPNSSGLQELDTAAFTSKLDWREITPHPTAGFHVHQYIHAALAFSDRMQQLYKMSLILSSQLCNRHKWQETQNSLAEGRTVKLLVAEIVPKTSHCPSGACLIHTYGIQSNPKTRRDRRCKSLYLQLLVQLYALQMHRIKPYNVCIHTNTEIHCWEVKLIFLLITKKEDRGKAFFMVSTEFLHYNDWWLSLVIILCLLCKTERRCKNLPQHLCKTGGEK